jgi:hypothetical protein
MNIRAFFSTFFGGLILTLILIVPAIDAFIFVLRCLIWPLRALQYLVGGGPPPDFWEL